MNGKKKAIGLRLHAWQVIAKIVYLIMILKSIYIIIGKAKRKSN